MARDGHKMHVAWVGPLPVVSVDHPETFKQLVAQAPEKALGQTDGYRFMMPWIGKLQLVRYKNNLNVQISWHCECRMFVTFESIECIYSDSIIQQSHLYTMYRCK